MYSIKVLSFSNHGNRKKSLLNQLFVLINSMNIIDVIVTFVGVIRMNIDSYHRKFSSEFDDTTSAHLKFLELLLRGNVGFLFCLLNRKCLVAILIV